jgi:hypothetical protein
MTDSIDLDEIETGTEEPEEERPNRGDWFWRGEGEPDPSESTSDPSNDDPNEAGTEAEGDAGGTDAGPSSGADTETATPHVPRENRDRPVGVPSDRGGAGGQSARAAATEPANTPESGEGEREASGPHGGGVDDMAMAFTYEAAKRLADPGIVFAGATWTDWIGIVGEVDAHVIKKFEREKRIDSDFFNGTGTGPAERLAGITETSMFFADRMVVVGCDGEEWIAEEAGWEFVPFETAAEKAGWEFD